MSHHMLQVRLNAAIKKSEFQRKKERDLAKLEANIQSLRRCTDFSTGKCT